MNKLYKSLLLYLLLPFALFQFSSCGKMKCNDSVGSGPYYSSKNGTNYDIDCQQYVNINVVSSNISNAVPILGCTGSYVYQLKEQVNINRQTNLLSYYDTIFIPASLPASAVVAFFVFTDSTRSYQSLLASFDTTLSALQSNASGYYIVINNNGNIPLSTKNIWAHVISAGCNNPIAIYVSGICNVDSGATPVVFDHFPFTGVIDANGNMQFLLESDLKYKVVTGHLAGNPGKFDNGSGVVQDIGQNFITGLTAAGGAHYTGGVFTDTIYAADVTQLWTKMTFSNQ